MNRRRLFYYFGILSSIMYSSVSDAVQGLSEIGTDIIQGPYALLNRLMRGGCYILGTALLMAGFVKYKRHKMNPQETPLLEPVVYTLLGIILVVIPFIYDYVVHYMR